MLSADAEFRAAANAAFLAWQHQPPYLSYRVDVDVDVPAMKQYRRISRAVEVRTSDDTAILQDLPAGQNQVGHAFPLIPTFDALSYFRLTFRLGDPLRQHNPLTQVTMIAPLHFNDPGASSADVVSVALRNYHAEYAADSGDRIAHIEMHPLAALTHGNDSDFYIHDVFVDTLTNLPTRVVYDGPTTEFAVDYTTAYGEYWLVDHAFYKHSIVAPLHIGQTTFTTDAHFDAFTFPATPADPRLH